MPYNIRSKPIKQHVIFITAVLVTLLAIFRRATSLIMEYDMISEPYTIISEEDILIRAGFTFTFSWLIIQFNANWVHYFSHLSKTLRVLITIVGNLIIAFVVIEILFLVYPHILDVPLHQTERERFYFGYFVVFIILFFIAGFLRYQQVNQRQVIENEHLKQQSLENELAALRNQINPHFLFNSLNSLNSLVRENKEATKFINKLSFMYRYILQSSDKKLVTLKEELKFLDSYIFLIKTRYRDKFSIFISIDDKYLDKKVPALALQLLVENAVKHNEISETNPLIVKVYSLDGYICIENKIRLRSTFVESTGKGLSNLNKRYLLLKNNEISISDTDGIFKVKFLLNN